MNFCISRWLPSAYTELHIDTVRHHGSITQKPGRRLTISDKESSLHGSLHVVPINTEPACQQDTNRQLAVIVMHHCGNNFQYFYIPIDCQTGVTTFAGKPSICLSWEMWISHGNSLLLGLHYWAGEHQTRPSEGPTSTRLVQTPRLEAAPMLFGFN